MKHLFYASSLHRSLVIWFVFFHHSISVTHHSSLITHHFKYYTRLTPSLNFHHSIFFTLFVGLIAVTHEDRTMKEDKKKKNTKNKSNQWKKKTKKQKEKKPKTNWSERKKNKKDKGKKKKNWIANQEKKGKKKRQKWLKVAAGYCLWVSYVCLITILSLSYELWKLKTAKSCFQFP